MNEMQCFKNEEELLFFADHELPAPRQDFLEQHLSVCRQCFLRYSVAAEMGRLVRASCGGVKAPDHLAARIQNDISMSAIGEGTGFWAYVKDLLHDRPVVPVAAAAVLVAAFFAALLVVPRNPQPVPLVAQMIREHDEYKEASSLSPGMISHDPLQISSWVAVNSGMSFGVPENSGFPIPHGVCSLDEGSQKIVCVLFDDGERHVSLFMMKDDQRAISGERIHEFKNTPLHCGRSQGKNYVVWKGKGQVNVLIGELPEESLVKMAEDLI